MSTINDLSKRTDRILDAINEASRALNRSSCGSVNGWGILSDPSMARLSLHEAKRKIEQALTLINQAKWPNSDAEWDALEAARNRAVRGDAPIRERASILFLERGEGDT